MVGHYRAYIFNGVGDPRSDTIVLLMLWRVAYNGQGMGIVLRVPRDSVSPTENG
jgi:hypothetical protein